MGNQPPAPTPIVTYGCEHLWVSVAGEIRSLTFSCGCRPERIIGNTTTVGGER